MRVLGIDPRVTQPPAGMADLATPDRLKERLGDAFEVLDDAALLDVEAFRVTPQGGSALPKTMMRLGFSRRPRV